MELRCVRDGLSVFFVIENDCSLVDMFWKREVIGKLYDVRSANETRVVLFSFSFRDSMYFCCSLCKQGGRAEETLRLLVALNYWFMWVYINTIDSSMTMIL